MSSTTGRRSGGGVIKSVDLLQEYMEKEQKRRAFLRGLLGTTALGGAALAGCGDNGGNTPAPGTDAGMGTDTGPAQDVPPMRTTHLVGVGHNDDHIQAAELALAETVGFSRIQRGQRVYLKVNTNSGDVYPYSTSPELIRWVVTKLRDLGAEVFIGDRSFWGDRNTMRNFQRNGIQGIAQELDVPLHVFGDAALDGASNAVEWVDLPESVEGISTPRSMHWDGTMRIPVMVAQADHIINMPVVKTHFIATFTMAMKNIIGIINPVDRQRPRNLGGHDGGLTGRLYRQTAFMNKAGPTVSLNVLDGYEALISGGPTVNDRPSGAPSGWMPMTAAPHSVIISPDAVAADLTGAALLRTLSPAFENIMRNGVLWDNRQLAVAIAAGIGITRRDQYDLSGPSVPNLEAIRALAIAE